MNPLYSYFWPSLIAATAFVSGLVIATVDALDYFYPLHEDEERPTSVVIKAARFFQDWIKNTFCSPRNYLEPRELAGFDASPEMYDEPAFDDSISGYDHEPLPFSADEEREYQRRADAYRASARTQVFIFPSRNVVKQSAQELN